MKRFAIFGTSGCGQGVLPMVRRRLNSSLAYVEVDLVFVDDHSPSSLFKVQRVLTYDHWLSEPCSSQNITVAIANSKVHVRGFSAARPMGVVFEVRAANLVQLDEEKLGDGKGCPSFCVNGVKGH